nr:Ec-gamma pheromone precursor [Moneuplotes crassus]
MNAKALLIMTLLLFTCTMAFRAKSRSKLMTSSQLSDDHCPTDVLMTCGYLQGRYNQGHYEEVGGLCNMSAEFCHCCSACDEPEVSPYSNCE